MNWIIFWILYSLQILATFPKFLDRCKSKTLETYSLYFFHHGIDIYIFWAFLFLTEKIEYFYHLIFNALNLIHWISYGHCFVTVYQNRLCGFKEHSNLNSIKNRLGLENFTEYFHSVWVGLHMIYDYFQFSSLSSSGISTSQG